MGYSIERLVNLVQLTLVISKSNGLSGIFRDIRTSSYGAFPHDAAYTIVEYL